MTRPNSTQGAGAMAKNDFNFGFNVKPSKPKAAKSNTPKAKKGGKKKGPSKEVAMNYYALVNSGYFG